ncbi:MAG: hypothetical protein ACRD0A_01315 [Acidimicrobiales bacterium]
MSPQFRNRFRKRPLANMAMVVAAVGVAGGAGYAAAQPGSIAAPSSLPIGSGSSGTETTTATTPATVTTQLDLELQSVAVAVAGRRRWERRRWRERRDDRYVLVRHRVIARDRHGRRRGLWVCDEGRRRPRRLPEPPDGLASRLRLDVVAGTIGPTTSGSFRTTRSCRGCQTPWPASRRATVCGWPD